MKTFVKCSAILAMVTASFLARGQNSSVAIGTPTTNDKAVLLLVSGSNNQGIIIPIVSGVAAVSAGASEKGMVVFDDSDDRVKYYDGASWTTVGSGGGSSTIGISGNTVTLGTGTSSFNIALTPPTGSPGQILMWNGTGWTSSTSGTLSTGSVLKWNAGTSSWEPGTDNVGAGSLPTLTSGQLVTNNGASNIAVTMIGDATFASSGALTISNNAVTTTKINNDAVTSAKIADNTIVGTDLSTSINISTTGSISTIGAGGNLSIGGNTTFNSRTYTWPSAAAGVNTFLRNDGSGNLTWASSSAALDVTGQTGVLIGNGATTTGLAATLGLQYLRRNSANTGYEFSVLSIVNADVNVGAAIDGSKITPTFTGNMSTTGNLSVSGNTTLTGTLAAAASTFSSLIVPGTTTFNTRTYTWSAAAAASNTFLRNDGSGNLTWVAGPSVDQTALASTTVPRSSGSAFLTSNIVSDGTNVGIGATQNANDRLIVTTTSQNNAISANNARAGASANIGVNIAANSSTLSNTGLFSSANGGTTATGISGASTSAASSTGYAVYGNALGTGTNNYAIYGTASGGTNNWAGYFANGHVAITNGLALGGSNNFGSIGEVLTSQGPGVAPQWLPAGGGFTLPYTASQLSASDLFNVTNTGTGGASTFTVSNAANGNHAMEASTSGTGSAVYGTATSITGTPGFFQQSNVASTAASVTAATAGLGNALTVAVTNAGSSNSALNINHAGIGNAITANRPIQGTNLIATGDVNVRGVSYTWPGANASGVLTNDGLGGLTWTPTAGFTTTNVVPKGSAGGLTSSTIFDNGSVGIGNTNPQGNLHVSGTTNGTIRITNTASGSTATDGLEITMASTGETSLLSREAGNLILGFNSNNVMFLTNAGRVGINDNSPSQALDVSGNIALTGALMPNALPGTAGQVLISAGAGLPPTWNNYVPALSPANTVIRGNAGGTAQVASSIFDNGTTYTGIGRSSAIGSSRFDIESGAASGAYGGMYINGAVGSKPFYGFSTGTIQRAWIESDGADADKLKFDVGGPRMTITQTGLVGVGLTSPLNRFDVEGGMAVGANYAGTFTAPTNSLIVEGSLGVGINAPAGGIDVNVTSAQALAYGMRAVNDYSGASNKYGLYTNLTATGSGTKYGIFNSVAGTSGSGFSIIGQYNDIVPNGTGAAWGTYNIISNAGTGLRYGTYNSIQAGSTNTQSLYGNYTFVNHAGTGPVYGAYIDANKATGQSGVLYGLNVTSDNDGTGDSYLLYSNSIGSTTGKEWGLYVTGEDVNFMSGSLAAASGNGATIGTTSVAMGLSSQATGVNSMTIGANSTAGGDYSVALGSYVNITGDGSIYIGDRSVAAQTTRTSNNRFYGRFDNGYFLYTQANESTGMFVNNGGSSWSVVSDSTRKENFRPVNGELLLSKLSKLKLGTWNYKANNKSMRHYGPMAQEFFEAFGKDGIGYISSDTAIASQDIEGVNMTAIQALVKRTDELRAEQKKSAAIQQELLLRMEEIESLRKALNNKETSEERVAELERDNKEMKAEIAGIKEALSLRSRSDKQP